MIYFTVKTTKIRDVLFKISEFENLFPISVDFDIMLPIMQWL